MGFVDEDKEVTKVVTVRMPKSIHELLKEAAYISKFSMNKFCIEALLQGMDDPFRIGREILYKELIGKDVSPEEARRKALDHFPEKKNNASTPISPATPPIKGRPATAVGQAATDALRVWNKQHSESDE